ncbi:MULTISPECIES: TM2 domain-containing protein [Acidithiobacillus]|uniref:TM2 domain-containing protein n=2 Tax=Acidithiobacillus TaxID=119977 RepID=A0A179B8Z8_ACIFR|nr:MULTISPECIES: TM2 domain-containing protein [Acidithiobacillus]MDA8181135.1 TM2 domain-containing protein [Acidithiobacillus sp.]MBU2853811.1 TM2 domain-containing protein [Acidithiobacillus ferriphilus]MEB8485525.1 TM2 domain-containing protein [Acidithiobacillus ferriphilus]MEB8490289.1 TM2 domain-containing protein [Acidithiobacillus ferriphilus]MEB8494727.1 TM2 domain-containing protein [Acidithiobacillus ferriphilus]
MPKAWEKLDLQGAGVQSLQIRLQKLQKKSLRSYLYWCLFPVGAHRFYLEQPWAWAFPLASAGVIMLAFLGLIWGAIGLAVVLCAVALRDLSRVSLWISVNNKELRKASWFAQQTPAAPPNHQGRVNTGEQLAQWQRELQDYTQAKEGERVGHPATNAPTQKGFAPGQRRLSFAEQERLLAAMTKAPKSVLGQEPADSAKK